MLEEIKMLVQILSGVLFFLFLELNFSNLKFLKKKKNYEDLTRGILCMVGNI